MEFLDKSLQEYYYIAGVNPGFYKGRFFHEGNVRKHERQMYEGTIGGGPGKNLKLRHQMIFPSIWQLK